MFNPLVIDSLKFFTGGYPASVGNGLSSVLQVNTKEPSTDKWHFYGTFDSAFETMIHGPVSDKVSTLFQFRRTFIEI